MAENLPTRGRRSKVAPPPLREFKPAPAPAHLTARAKKLWRSIVNEWVLDDGALPLLRAGLEQLDLYDRARAQLDREGLTIETGQGMRRAHPCHKVAQDALASFRQCFRQLGLEPPST